MIVWGDIASTATLVGAILGAAATALLSKILLDASARRTAHARFLADRYLPIWRSLETVISEFSPTWSDLAGDRRGAYNSRVGRLGAFEPWHAGWSDAEFDIEVLQAMSNGHRKLGDMKLDEDVWEYAHRDLQAYVETAVGTLALIGKQVSSLAEDMELEGIHHRIVKRSRLLASLLRQFNGYVLACDGPFLTHDYLFGGEDEASLVESKEPGELEHVQSLIYLCAKECLWVYKASLRAHKRESVGSVAYRLTTSIVRWAWIRIQRGYYGARGWLGLDGRPFAAVVRRWKLHYEVVNIRVRAKHVAAALNLSKQFKASVVEMREMGTNRGVVLVYRCRVSDSADLRDTLAQYGFKRGKPRPGDHDWLVSVAQAPLTWRS